MTDDIVTRLRRMDASIPSVDPEMYVSPTEAADEIERLRTVLRKANICAGCDQPWQDEAHIHGKTKCCPDCSHEYPKAVRGE